MAGRLRGYLWDELRGRWWLGAFVILAAATTASWVLLGPFTKRLLWDSASPALLDDLSLVIAQHYTTGHLVAQLIALSAGVRLGARWRERVAGPVGSGSAAVRRSDLLHRCGLAATVGVLLPALPMVVTVPLAIARIRAWGYGDTPDAAELFTDPVVLVATAASVLGGVIWAVLGVGLGALTGPDRWRRWRFGGAYLGLILLAFVVAIVTASGHLVPVGLLVLMLPSNYFLVDAWLGGGWTIVPGDTRWYAATATLLLAVLAASAVVMAARAARHDPAEDQRDEPQPCDV